MARTWLSYVNYILVQPLSEAYICSWPLSACLNKTWISDLPEAGQNNFTFFPSVLYKSLAPFINHHGSPSPSCLLYRHLPGAALCLTFSCVLFKPSVSLSNSNYNPHSSSRRIPRNSSSQTPLPHNCTFTTLCSFIMFQLALREHTNNWIIGTE